MRGPHASNHRNLQDIHDCLRLAQPRALQSKGDESQATISHSSIQEKSRGSRTCIRGSGRRVDLGARPDRIAAIAVRSQDGAALEQATLLEVVEQAVRGAVLQRAAEVGGFWLQVHDATDCR
jgi:hypothetical protein